MKFLSTPAEISLEFNDLAKKAKEIFISVAWASNDFDSYNHPKKL